MAFVESRSLNISIVMHALLVLVAFVGLPAILPDVPEPQPLVMSVEILPITGVTNVKPSDKPIEKEQNAPTPKPPKPVEPNVKEPPKLVAPTPPKPTPQPKDAAEKKPFDPNEGAEPDEAEEIVKKKTPPKPVEEPKKKEEAKPKADEFAKLLETLSKENPTPAKPTTPATPAPAKDGKDKATVQENKTRSDAPYDASLPMSMSEKDAIRSQFIPCWRFPAGAKDAASLAVRVKVELLADGTVKTAVIAPDQLSRYNSDTYFRAAADSAVRAVHKCSPLKNLPADKFGTWSNMEINFDPKDML